MKNIAILKTNRSMYDAKSAADQSITIREFIDLLKENFYDLDTKIVFSNDGGYTYGYIKDYTIDEIEVEDEEDKRREQEEWDRGVYENSIKEMNIELTELEAIYENAKPGDENYLTDEEYRQERKYIFDSWGISEEEFEKSLDEILG